MGIKEKIMDLFVDSEFDDSAEEYTEQSNSHTYEEMPRQNQPVNERNNIRANKDKFSGLSTNKNNSINSQNSGQLKVRVTKPETFEEAKEIANYLNDKYTVILNLESTGKDLSRRLIDFLSGVAYANNGRIKPVANSTFIITPHNVDVTGDDLWQSYASEDEYI